MSDILQWVDSVMKCMISCDRMFVIGLLNNVTHTHLVMTAFGFVSQNRSLNRLSHRIF